MEKAGNKSEALALGLGLFSTIVIAVLYSFSPTSAPIVYEQKAQASAAQVEKPQFVATHVPTPSEVKGIYMTQCTAGEKTLRNKLVDLVDGTELNSIVIDIKDYSGRISFKSDVPILADKTSPSCYAEDMPQFIDELHKKGIYVIGRITTFQDPYLANKEPDLAVKSLAHPDQNWHDKKGISYLDPGATGAWDYIVALAEESYRIGFDEINFDYIRFPSDGDMSDVYYPSSDAILKSDPKWGKVDVLREFFAYLSNRLKPRGIVISADLFGMTTTNTDDLNIGQILEEAVDHFDFVDPMVYPSHYPTTFMGFANPADKPYEVIKYSMSTAVSRASTTPEKLRPWLQDFNLGAIYNADMVRLEKQATYDSGLNSWLMWNAANRYTKDALDLK